MDKLKHMKTFMLVVEEGSIVNAARRLGITKAGASKQIIDLEAQLNTQLLQRTTRTLKLTDSGNIYYSAIKSVFAAVSNAEASVMQTQENPSGTLRVASHRYFGERFIVNNMSEFLNLYPNLKIDLELADRFPDLERENIDILCGIGHEGPDHLVRKKIATINHILCASPAYIEKHGAPKFPEDLKHHRYITHSFRDPDNILSFKNGKEVYLDYFLRLNDAQAMLKCALQGLGFIKIFNYFVAEYLQSGGLVELLKDFREPPKSLYIFYQQQKFMPSKIRVFIDFIYHKIKHDENISFASQQQ